MLNEQLLDQLFSVEKSTPLYRQWFTTIWGAPDLFKKFLKNAGTQIQKTLAIDIVQQMISLSNFSIPSSAFTCLVEVEHQGNDEGWINQEHAVHSVNVYICCIYLFFFYEPLQRELLKYFKKAHERISPDASPLDEIIGDIIRCLRLSALYHDIGYTLERAVDLSGRFNSKSGVDLNDLLTYRFMDCEIIYDILIKAISRYIFSWIMIFEDNGSFETSLINNNWIDDSSIWSSCQNSEQINGSTLKNNLGCKMGDMVELSYIHSWDGFKFVAPYLSSESVLTVISDHHLRPIIINFESKDHKETYFTNNKSIHHKFTSNNYKLTAEELASHGYHLNYYIHQKTTPLPEGIGYLTDSFAFISKQCKQRFSSDFGLLFREENIPTLLHKISQWIEHKVPLVKLDETRELVSIHKKQSSRDNKLITTIYQDHAFKILKEQSLSILDIDSQMKDLGTLFLEQICSEQFLSELYKEYNKKCNADPDTSCDEQLCELMRVAYHWIKHYAYSEKKPAIEIRKPKRDAQPQIIFHALDKERFCGTKTMQKFHAYSKRNITNIGLTWDKILNYRSPYTYYDHGKISAGLFIESYGIYSTIMEKIGHEPFIQNIWKIPTSITRSESCFELSPSIVEAFFAILMHNIFVKSSTIPNGLDYIHNTTTNPMSYFLAFCDTLQFWDRDKIFDPAKQRQPDNTFYGKDFDIDIWDNKIRIRCKVSGDKEKIISKLMSMDEYIQDASRIVVVQDSI